MFFCDKVFFALFFVLRLISLFCHYSHVLLYTFLLIFMIIFLNNLLPVEWERSAYIIILPDYLHFYQLKNYQYILSSSLG